MSEQSPLTRIAITCAGIVLGTVFVGAQLSTTGGLSQVASTVAEEEDDADERASVSPDDEAVEEDIEEIADEESEATEEESDEYAFEDGDAFEDRTNEQAAEEAQEEAEEEEGGFTAVRRNP